MIISHKHKFIFLKSNKTAGTSIEIALSKFCGPDDIITQLWPDEEALRSSKGYPTAQNWKFPLEKHHFLHRLKVRMGKTKQLYYNHVRACEIKPYIDPDIWNSYYKFVVTRNPWDRVVSMYFFELRKGVNPTPEEFLSSKMLRRINRRGWGLYTINDEVVVDKICRYENLAQDLETARLAIGLPESIELPQVKTAYRKDKSGYREVPNDRLRDRIGAEFRKEIELLGYGY